MIGEDKKEAQRRDRRRRLAQARSNTKKAVSDALKEFAAGDKEALPKALYFYFSMDPRGRRAENPRPACPFRRARLRGSRRPNPQGDRR